MMDRRSLVFGVSTPPGMVFNQRRKTLFNALNMPLLHKEKWKLSSRVISTLGEINRQHAHRAKESRPWRDPCSFDDYIDVINQNYGDLLKESAQQKLASLTKPTPIPGDEDQPGIIEEEERAPTGVMDHGAVAGPSSAGLSSSTVKAKLRQSTAVSKAVSQPRVARVKPAASSSRRASQEEGGRPAKMPRAGRATEDREATAAHMLLSLRGFRGTASSSGVVWIESEHLGLGLGEASSFQCRWVHGSRSGEAEYRLKSQEDENAIITGHRVLGGRHVQEEFQVSIQAIPAGGWDLRGDLTGVIDEEGRMRARVSILPEDLLHPLYEYVEREIRKEGKDSNEEADTVDKYIMLAASAIKRAKAVREVVSLDRKSLLVLRRLIYGLRTGDEGGHEDEDWIDVIELVCEFIDIPGAKAVLSESGGGLEDFMKRRLRNDTGGIVDVALDCIIKASCKVDISLCPLTFCRLKDIIRQLGNDTNPKVTDVSTRNAAYKVMLVYIDAGCCTVGRVAIAAPQWIESLEDYMETHHPGTQLQDVCEDFIEYVIRPLKCSVDVSLAGLKRLGNLPLLQMKRRHRVVVDVFLSFLESS